MKKVAPTISSLIALVTAAAGIGFASQSHAQTNIRTEPVAPVHVSLFTVPLQCGSAPEIGCGSRAKPLLLKLEQNAAISEAWLNAAGTVLAVVAREASTRETRATAVQSILENAKTTMTELDGEQRERELKSFASKNGWYRTVAVDELSKQEAGIIAARLVRRIQAKIALPDAKAKALESGFAGVLTQHYTSDASERKSLKNQTGPSALAKVAHAHLDPAGLLAFEAAVANGYRPQSNEK